MFTDPHAASTSAQGSGELNGRQGIGSSFFTGSMAILRGTAADHCRPW
jgi:hypothetical protein